ncbi:unnamed protein product [Spirodela intermedia]|uniref:Uncharacterized protein n=1 Tax=Spirodela intermedia TaxID=51605 RepID=A0A7I8JIG2_SPIIN|nr:unnamed protein product [Spirodela intermedia]CAA6669711.1 unnamed protein product [Spirodela intermedia]
MNLQNINQQPRLLKDNFTPYPCDDLLQNPICPKEIKPSVFQMLPSFYGRQHEDPYAHLKEFQRIYEHSLGVQARKILWYAHIVNYLVIILLKLLLQRCYNMGFIGQLYLYIFMIFF